jgi:hypothetical protein
MWFTCGQGRFTVHEQMRGYTAHNAIFLPANTPHAVETCGRTQGTALFLGARSDLPVPREVLHLRLSSLKQQTELNQLVEGFRQDCSNDDPLADEIRHHRAALIALWLTQQAIKAGLETHQPAPLSAETPADTPLPAKDAGR